MITEIHIRGENGKDTNTTPGISVAWYSRHSRHSRYPLHPTISRKCFYIFHFWVHFLHYLLLTLLFLCTDTTCVTVSFGSGITLFLWLALLWPLALFVFSFSSPSESEKWARSSSHVFRCSHSDVNHTRQSIFIALPSRFITSEICRLNIVPDNSVEIEVPVRNVQQRDPKNMQDSDKTGPT